MQFCEWKQRNLTFLMKNLACYLYISFQLTGEFRHVSCKTWLLLYNTLFVCLVYGPKSLIQISYIVFTLFPSMRLPYNLTVHHNFQVTIFVYLQTSITDASMCCNLMKDLSRCEWQDLKILSNSILEQLLSLSEIVPVSSTRYSNDKRLISFRVHSGPLAFVIISLVCKGNTGYLGLN